MSTSIAITVFMTSTCGVSLEKFLTARSPIGGRANTTLARLSSATTPKMATALSADKSAFLVVDHYAQNGDANRSRAALA
jgi:hypothetical protein